MQFSIRLKQLVDGLPGHQRGPIMRICDATGLERHTVAALYHNRVRYVSMKTLATICDYLVERAGVPRAEVLQRLFGLEVGDFWGMLVRPQHLRVCCGMRNVGEPTARRWVMASDAMLQGKLLHKISQSALQVTSGAERGAHDGDAGAPVARGNGAVSGAARGQILEQHLVAAPPGLGRSEEAIAHAEEVYQWVNEFRDGEQALVCLGSPKSNPVAELVYARAFGLTPFRSALQQPTSNRCPIFYLYRDDGPQPESCCGGTKLPGARRGDPRPKPGIYVEKPDGRWAHCPCDDDKHMCAVVFYVYRRDWGRVETVIGGFSSRSTEQLAMVLPTLSTQELLPCYESSGLKVGAVVLEFKIEQSRGTQPAGGAELRRPSIETRQIDEEVMSRRVVD